MRILAIETSCDETAAAVVEDGVKVLSSAVATSAAMHEKYGGIVPEVASREQLKCIIPTIEEAMKPHKNGVNVSVYQCIGDTIDAIAVTVGPGLIGSLLVGVETAKTIAFVTGKLIIPVNHVLAHSYANFLINQQIQFPAISLVVSGGHTELYLMKNIKDLTWLGGTLDDAAGEAFDKTARLLGFGNGGGAAIQEASSQLKIENCKLKIILPRPMMHDDSLNFSFSGLKTAILREWKKLELQGLTRSDLVINALAYEVQEAITDVLVKKTLRAAQLHRAKSLLLSGGVAANLRLREKFSTKLETLNSKLFVPPAALCTDNAVTIAAYAYFKGKQGDWHTITAVPDLSVEIPI
ncbi:tRNA (adenosine(37)-N6)-threonylcarbamoyltransferase complex transferase subunit TsaD [Candidatus Gottesmanbacteria bacterium RIFCSPLOWO2_01_FULL_48_11]|uniref:tRNA N6-adenosine threonylcarbamoyltransferase n=3 Tax=Candidatus Gottesmaniibacteriota TaxID=1752720 RepID=A0A0G1UQ03_9BACT|nr:MAG: putative tRNA threonylcarbamoyladenosine biosynthesis protein Gcp [Candidatus Gottesmanbacteria bacterium GW2011_GWA2_47_9]KKU96224.1 MAG: putative tRNA threonylcarbamoyladenosine biosynthesis protein Gcp [Candidatus Gottesmanbacteria bacterium GW2011_GWA1_48_13]OGG28515.1 MAG: tRNA (adenosine(37)-N6)-threonylcarbamoyltransferase complex transferase subunit TsaD [Candidatus Gottesmanbacteria bacterium RIFCSPLOWO2_01_FULL_48_11]HCS79393.1 tRNA (adenosine(37)-N6)-threonylcarbamoyltransfera